MKTRAFFLCLITTVLFLAGLFLAGLFLAGLFLAGFPFATFSLNATPGPDRALVQLAAITWVIVTSWLWVRTIRMATLIFRPQGVSQSDLDRHPRWLTSLCGLGLLMAGPAQAAPDHPNPASVSTLLALDGLPIPEVPTTAAGNPNAHLPRSTTHKGHTVVVRPGDSLWAIADRALGKSDLAKLMAYVDALYKHNQAVIGTNPHLLFPGQVLQLPERAH
jgi:hypothetical protein